MRTARPEAAEPAADDSSGPPPGDLSRGDVAECRSCGFVFVWKRVAHGGACKRCRGADVARWRPPA